MDFLNEKIGYILVGIVIIIIIYLSYKPVIDKIINYNNPVSNFEHRLPKDRYPDVVNEFGKPTQIINQTGGLIKWSNKDYFEEIVLKDESIEHMKPAPHCDFLYATINVYIPEDIVPIVMSLSKSVYYDNLKKELTARCHFMGANVSTLLLAMNIANDSANVNMYKNKYKDTIMSTSNPTTYKELYDELGNIVISNQNKYKNNMPNKKCNINV